MRSFLAGLILTGVAASTAAGQVRGEVESIGFGSSGWFRPQCWTPMVVRLKSQISEPAEYRIEVHQHDLDFDHVIYVKEGITLNGQATQRWEVCFLPEPIHGGLPEGSIRDLQDRLRVYLTNKEGTRQLLQLPITSAVTSLDPRSESGWGSSRAFKLVLVVMDGSSRPALSEASYDKAVGLVEQPMPVAIRPPGLPQNMLSYQAVDAVVWISGDAHALSEQGSTQLTALQGWLRQGGTLIVCQPGNDAERQKIEPFAEMLPIKWKENGQWKVSVKERNTLDPLVALTRPKTQFKSWGPRFWKLKGPFQFARATTRPSAIVEPGDWITWDDPGSDQTPYIARALMGLGCVTWVAQDLGNPSITGPDTAGWPYVWDHVFGWSADTHLLNDRSELVQAAYPEMTDVADFGSAQMQGVEFGAKGAGLIVVAVGFFIVYWLVAGPGSYLLLANKKRKDLSWAAFGLTALGATAVTVIVVRLILRGSPEVHHASDVRIEIGTDAQPAMASSRIGLYIPRDGDQRIALADATGEFVSYVTPMPVPPSSNDNDFPANLDYAVPEPGSGTGDAAIDVPFRSTLKKLQAAWCGDVKTTIRGAGLKLNPQGGAKNPIAGALQNLTGIDLRNIYVAFHSGGSDLVLFVPSWPASGSGSQIDLLSEFSKAEALPIQGDTRYTDAHPGDGKSCRGDIEHQWTYWWQRSASSETVEDLHQATPNSFPVVSFFSRIPPWASLRGESSFKAITRLRRGARNLDMSPALAAGQLVVLAQADDQPLPFPLEVNGTRVGGDGTVFYQFALPLDRAGSSAPPQ